MKVFFFLFIVITDQEGYETMKRVNDVQYKTKLDCMVAKAHHKELEGRIQFFCGENYLYLKK